jgi:hypothetical protein
MNTKKFLFFAVMLVMVSACQPAAPTVSVKDQASTMVAETAEAAPPTETPTVAPTETTAPSPTVTVTPTVTLTPTPTGPLKVTDDFSAKSDIWGKCDKCEWKDGRLFFGPFPPRGNGIDQVFSIVCEACGEHSYFRIAADLTFADGVAGDREYGVGLTADGEYMAGTGIAPSLFGALEAWNIKTGDWTGSNFKRYSAIKPGTATNRVEFQAKPNAAGGTDYYAIVNGKTLLVLSNIIKYSETLKPAIYLGWHSVGISIDNFEYEEIEP